MIQRMSSMITATRVFSWHFGVLQNCGWQRSNKRCEVYRFLEFRDLHQLGLSESIPRTSSTLIRDLSEISSREGQVATARKHVELEG